jgi:ribonuclease III
MIDSYSLSPKRIKELEQLCQKLGVLFGRLAVLNEALTHSSFAAETPGARDYERLEFFGDSVLRFVVSEYLLERFPEYDEGQLTSIRSVLVSDKTLAEIAQEFGLSKYILLGRQVQMRPSIMARSMEAIFGAVYNDLGLFEVQNLVLRLFGSRATDVDKDEAKDNYKAQLQEYSQGGGQGVPVYTVEKI